MTLRIMLVGLVASMGFEMPSGPEVSSWATSGRDWVQARWFELSGPAVEADRPDAAPADCLQAEASPSDAPELAVAPDDAAFAAVSESMAASFADDALAMRDEPSPAEESPASLSVAVGLPEGEEPAESVAEAAEPAPAVVAESDDRPTCVSGEEDESPSRVDRVSSAVQLTREAIRAWADLMSEPEGEGEPCLSY